MGLGVPQPFGCECFYRPADLRLRWSTSPLGFELLAATLADSETFGHHVLLATAHVTKADWAGNFGSAELVESTVAYYLWNGLAFWSVFEFHKIDLLTCVPLSIAGTQAKSTPNLGNRFDLGGDGKLELLTVADAFTNNWVLRSIGCVACDRETFSVAHKRLVEHIRT